MQTVFDFSCYKKFLTTAIAERPNKGRGFRSTLARALGCQTAYISQVINGTSNFSLEQAQAVSKLLGQTQQENRFFLLLVNYERAGSHELRKFYESEIAEQRLRFNLLYERIRAKDHLTTEDKVTYYSEWHYVAIHMLVCIPRYQSSHALAEALNLPVTVVNAALDFLVSCSMVDKDGDRYSVGNRRLHIGGDSPLALKHHLNWRLRGVQSLQMRNDDDLHYTSIVTVSQKDKERLKKLMIKTIEDYNDMVAPSPDETSCCLSLDFFSLVE